VLGTVSEKALKLSEWYATADVMFAHTDPDRQILACQAFSEKRIH
jgi:hypothetical protein